MLETTNSSKTKTQAKANGILATAAKNYVAVFRPRLIFNYYSSFKIFKSRGGLKKNYHSKQQFQFNYRLYSSFSSVVSVCHPTRWYFTLLLATCIVTASRSAAHTLNKIHPVDNEIIFSLFSLSLPLLYIRKAARGTLKHAKKWFNIYRTHTQKITPHRERGRCENIYYYIPCTRTTCGNHNFACYSRVGAKNFALF